MLRRYLVHCPDEVLRISAWLTSLPMVLRGMGLCIYCWFLLLSLGLPGMERKSVVRVALPPLRMFSGPIQHLQSTIFEAWQLNVSAQLADRKGFRGAQFLDIKGSLQLLNSSHLRERDNMLLRSILCGRVWNGFLLGKSKGCGSSVPLQWRKGRRWTICFGIALFRYSLG